MLFVYALHVQTHEEQFIVFYCMHVCRPNVYQSVAHIDVIGVRTHEIESDAMQEICYLKKLLPTTTLYSILIYVNKLLLLL